MRTDRHPLPQPAPGTRRELTVHRFGREGARPKVWIQAALHADELPGAMALHYLMPMLAAAERAGTLIGEVFVAPTANPVGLAQQMAGRPMGRFAFDGTGNFNRGFADLCQPLADAVSGKLGRDPAQNAGVVREALRSLLPPLTAGGEAPTLKRVLQQQACDADIVLDLHCDQFSSVHIYCAPQHSDPFVSLGARLGATAVLTAEDSGDVPFDEAIARPWLRLAETTPNHPVSKDACVSCTVELRGEADIADDLGRADAQGLYDWLQERGAIAGTAPRAPAARCGATPLDGVDMIRSPVAGILVSTRAPGTVVAAGDVVGEVIDPLDPSGSARTPVVSRVAGVMFARATPGLVRPHDTVAKVAGVESLPDRKGLLLEL